jgi:DNA (cytosine-5)-methyltransferase 1
MQVAWQVEFDPFCQQILQKYWPEVTRYGDIRAVKGDELEPVDLICGGFPCQPHSIAGKRKASDDERDLWPEMLRIIREVGPRWVVAENVPGLLSSEAGRFFGAVLRDLAESGYSVGWDCIHASAVGAPHRRERVIIIAELADTHAERRGRRAGASGPTRSPEPTDSSALAHTSRRQSDRRDSGELAGTAGAGAGIDASSDAGGETMANAESERWGTRRAEPEGQQRGSGVASSGSTGRSAESRLGRVLDGLSRGLDAVRYGYDWPSGPGQPQRRWEPPRVSVKIPNRAKRLKALGNAVVPQVAELVGRVIMAVETEGAARCPDT